MIILLRKKYNTYLQYNLYSFNKYLNETFWKYLYIYQELDSTHILAINSNYSKPTIILAEKQTNGIGRFIDRRWISKEFCSLTISSVIPNAYLNGYIKDYYSLIFIQSLLEILDKYELYLRLPNDIVDKNNRKIAGILSVLTDDNIIISSGINCNQFTNSHNILSLSSLLNEKIDIPNFLTILLRKYYDLINKYIDSKQLIDDLNKRLFMKDKRITIIYLDNTRESLRLISLKSNNVIKFIRNNNEIVMINSESIKRLEYEIHQ